MKKLIFVFIALFVVVLISGCGTRQNTVRFDENRETGRNSENTDQSEPAENTDAETVSKEPTVLTVSSFEGSHLETNNRYNVIEGTVPAGTHTVKVNDYSLQRFIPGQTQWSYIAATSLNTLETGLNSYLVEAYDANGNEIDALTFTVNYKVPAVAALPDVGSSHWFLLILSAFLSGSYFILRRYSVL